MEKSFVERIFPHSGSSRPPLDKPSRREPLSRSASPSSSTASPVRRPGQQQHPPLARSSLRDPPLAASIVHHADPLLPIERAAKSLERHIQSLLDAQSESLLSGLEGDAVDDISSTGSLTPTPSGSTTMRKSIAPKVIPVRQPTEKPLSLREARRGLRRSLKEFARLKTEELQILDGQAHDREEALQAAQMFEDKRTALEQQAQSVADDSGNTKSKSIRGQASKLEQAIQEQEDKLFEMKAQLHQLLEEAKQVESSVESQLSSYRSSVAMTDMEIRRFLRNPPVTHVLPEYLTGNSQTGMYAMKPERRTISMAKEQWKFERNMLRQRRYRVESEYAALEDGSRLWKSAVERISTFERDLRVQINTIRAPQAKDKESSQGSLLSDFDIVIRSLEDDLATAESNHWNLLICALGAEIEALHQGRRILAETLSLTTPVNHPPNYVSDNRTNTATHVSEQEDSTLPEDLIHYDNAVDSGALNSPSTNSNKSLEATLNEFAQVTPSATGSMNHTSNSQHDFGASEPVSGYSVRRDRLGEAAGSKAMSRSLSENGDSGGRRGAGPASEALPTSWRKHTRSDSEDDDDPGPAFLLSH